MSEALSRFQGIPPRAPLDGSGEETSPTERLAAVLWEKRGYFLTLESLYTKHLTTP
jgi:hypothetical protein